MKPKDGVCQACKLEAEDDVYFLLQCVLYQVLRKTLLANKKSKDNFDTNTISQEIIFLKLISEKKNERNSEIRIRLF